jgi:Flp pilus assembly protein TadG
MFTPADHIKNDDGQALVEFALVLPLLLLILFSMIHFGKAINYWNDATHLTAEAARYAVVNRKPDPNSPLSLQAQIRNQADTPELRNGSVSVVQPAQVCVDFPNGTMFQGDPVRVRMTFVYAWLPLIGNKISTTQSTITSTTVMRLEAPPTVYSVGCA